MKSRIISRPTITLEKALVEICENMPKNQRLKEIDDNINLTKIQKLILKSKIRKIYRKANKIKRRNNNA